MSSSVLMSSRAYHGVGPRAYHGVGPTLDARYVKKSKVLPDPVPRSEMEH